MREATSWNRAPHSSHQAGSSPESALARASMPEARLGVTTSEVTASSSVAAPGSRGTVGRMTLSGVDTKGRETKDQGLASPRGRYPMPSPGWALSLPTAPESSSPKAVG